MDFFLYIFAAVGLSHILADGSIMIPIKLWLSGEEKNWFSKRLFRWKPDGFLNNKILNLLNCYQCNGWWSGLITAIVGWLGLTWLLWAFAISLVSPLFGYLKLYFSMLTSVDNYQEEDEDEQE